MQQRLKIMAVCGSTRSISHNLNLIRAFASISKTLFDTEIYTGIADLPHFNPDLDQQNPPPEIASFRNKIASASGVLICTPEYAMGVPGTLKNALDWTVSTCEFSKKPTALITASTSGFRAHEALLHTLQVIEADIDESTQLIISYIKTKVNGDGNITDPSTLKLVVGLINAFKLKIESKTNFANIKLI